MTRWRPKLEVGPAGCGGGRVGGVHNADVDGAPDGVRPVVQEITVKKMYRKIPINVYAAIYIYSVWDFQHTPVWEKSHTCIAHLLDKYGIFPRHLCRNNPILVYEICLTGLGILQHLFAAKITCRCVIFHWRKCCVLDLAFEFQTPSI